MQLQNIPKIKHIDSGQFFLIAGPCAIENEKMALRIAESVCEITSKLKIPYILKEVSKKLIEVGLIALLESEMKRHLKF